MAKLTATTGELRSFGLIFAAMVAVLFGLLIPWLAGHPWPYWPWYIGGVVGTLGLVAPPLLYPLYRVWMAFGMVAGWINTRLILGLLFFVMLLPVGLLMKLIGRDPMRRGFDREATSYRIARTPAARDHMEKPY